MTASPAIGELPVIGKGISYRIREDDAHYILEDSTKDGLGAVDRVPDGNLQSVETERGIIHDIDGIGRHIPIRWYFPKGPYGIEEVLTRAGEMDRRYAAIRETACPGG